MTRTQLSRPIKEELRLRYLRGELEALKISYHVGLMSPSIIGLEFPPIVCKNEGHLSMLAALRLRYLLRWPSAAQEDIFGQCLIPARNIWLGYYSQKINEEAAFCQVIGQTRGVLDVISRIWVFRGDRHDM